MPQAACPDRSASSKATGKFRTSPRRRRSRQENGENWIDRDPELKCYLPGIPRAMYMPYPFQIVQSANKIHMAFAFTSTGRTIHLDEVEGPPDLTYMGHSVGRWDGDTLVVDVTEFNGKNWFDRAGNYHSEALHLTERFTPITKDAIHYEVTIEDPNVFTRPWKISMPLYRRLEPNAQLLEYRCIEFVEEFMYGGLRKQPLVSAGKARRSSSTSRGRFRKATSSTSGTAGESVQIIRCRRFNPMIEEDSPSLPRGSGLLSGRHGCVARRRTTRSRPSSTRTSR